MPTSEIERRLPAFARGPKPRWLGGPAHKRGVRGPYALQRVLCPGGERGYRMPVVYHR